MANTARKNVKPEQYTLNVDCDQFKKDDPPPPPPNGCATLELCAKVKKLNKAKGKRKRSPSPSNDDHPQNHQYVGGKRRFANKFNAKVKAFKADGGTGKPPGTKKYFMHECRWEKWDGNEVSRQEMNPDHVKDAGLWGSLKEHNLLWLSEPVNKGLGRTMSGYKPAEHKGGVKAPKACNCG
jgi:hypothetical protein